MRALQTRFATRLRLVKWLTTWVALGAILIFSTGSHAMGKMHLFSAVQGVVVHKGAPVEGAVVEREYLWHWKDKKSVDVAKTDAQGRFQLPMIVESSFLGSLLPHEPVVRQTILIKHGGKTYEAWLFNRRDYEANTELAGRPISLLCDLDMPMSHKGPDGKVYGMCELR
jgi:hypothetical protein